MDCTLPDPAVGSCATCRQDSDREKLLYENDMLQAKLIIVANDRDRSPLAQALLEARRATTAAARRTSTRPC